MSAHTRIGFPCCPSVCAVSSPQAGAYFSEQLNEQLVDALLEYGEKQLVGA